MILPETIELETKERHNAHVRINRFTPYINKTIGLIVAPWRFHVLKTSIFSREFEVKLTGKICETNTSQKNTLWKNVWRRPSNSTNNLCR